MMAERPKILVTQKVPDPAYPLLEAIGDVEANMEEGVIWPYEELLRRGPGHDYIYSLLTDNIDARFLEAGAASTPRLRWSRTWPLASTILTWTQRRALVLRSVTL